MPESEPPVVMRRGVVGVIVRGGRLLVIQRSQHVVAPGAYCFPGGGIEPLETEHEALIRELQEELGVEVEPLVKLWDSVTPWGTALAWWRAGLSTDAVLIPNPLEVETAEWLTLTEMTALPDLLESNRHFLAALARGEFALEEG
jgi:8-oxo-dGTP diphosphatase